MTKQTQHYHVQILLFVGTSSLGLVSAFPHTPVPISHLVKTSTIERSNASERAFFKVAGKKSSKHCTRQPSAHILSSAASQQSDKVQVNTEFPVSRISVCAGELCQCQGEEYEYTGGAADAVIKDLQSLELPFPIDEVGCLGACGMGTMVAIDFENGDSIMTDGLDSTLTELGISKEKLQVGSTASSSEHGVQNFATTIGNEGNVESSSTKDVVLVSTENKVGSNPPPKKPPIVEDVRDRMRQEAAVESDTGNPWMNMASYLAKKATDKVFRS